MDEVERKSVMLDVLYEDKDVLVVVKPAGIESQTSRRLEPDMVSEIKNYLHRKAQEAKKLSTGLSPKASTVTVEPYVGVIHRLDKPVRGVMVYAKNQKAAAHLSRQVQDGKLEKIYQAVVCGKPVDNCGSYVDYLRHCKENNTSEIVDKSCKEAKRGVLNYRVREVINNPQKEGEMLSLIDIELLTGRHHQIRVQFAGHGTPLYGDSRYGGDLSTLSTGNAVDRKRGEIKEMKGTNVRSERGDWGKRPEKGPGRQALALCAYRLAFPHPVTGKEMEFTSFPIGGAFSWFPALREDRERI